MRRYVWVAPRSYGIYPLSLFTTCYTLFWNTKWPPFIDISIVLETEIILKHNWILVYTINPLKVHKFAFNIVRHSLQYWFINRKLPVVLR